MTVRQVPSIRSFLTHLGASVSLAGLLIGCCDLTSMPSTVGAQPPCPPRQRCRQNAQKKSHRCRACSHHREHGPTIAV